MLHCRTHKCIKAVNFSGFTYSFLNIANFFLKRKILLTAGMTTFLRRSATNSVKTIQQRNFGVVLSEHITGAAWEHGHVCVRWVCSCWFASELCREVPCCVSSPGLSVFVHKSLLWLMLTLTERVSQPHTLSFSSLLLLSLSEVQKQRTAAARLSNCAVFCVFLKLKSKAGIS